MKETEVDLFKTDWAYNLRLKEELCSSAAAHARSVVKLWPQILQIKTIFDSLPPKTAPTSDPGISTTTAEPPVWTGMGVNFV
jgi:hypothetical protein